MSGAKPRSAWPTTSRTTVKQNIVPLPLTSTHSSLSLAQSPQTGRGQNTQVPQSRHFCIMSLPALAPSQNGWLTGVISGRGFLIIFSSDIGNSCSTRAEFFHHEATKDTKVSENYFY